MRLRARGGSATSLQTALVGAYPRQPINTIDGQSLGSTHTHGAAGRKRLGLGLHTLCNRIGTVARGNVPTQQRYGHTEKETQNRRIDTFRRGSVVTPSGVRPTP